MDVAATIYIIFAVTLTLFFMLTRSAMLHIKLDRKLLFGIELTFLGFEVKWDSSDTNESNGDDNVPLNAQMLKTIISITKKLFRFISRCFVHIRCISIPYRKRNGSYLAYFRLIGMFSALYAFADSKTMGISAENNALILSSDQNTLEFDVTIKVMLLDIFILVMGLLSEIVKIGKMEKSNVGN